MKRYKTVLGALCGNGHQNLVDDRVFAESTEQAKNQTLLNIQKRKCTWCDSLLTNRITMFGTEELPFHPVYNIMGYTCHCGERVEVFRAEDGRQFDTPMDQITVECSKGHSRTVRNQEFLSLQHWTENTQ